jgi:hypothetical protein
MVVPPPASPDVVSVAGGAGSAVGGAAGSDIAGASMGGGGGETGAAIEPATVDVPNPESDIGGGTPPPGMPAIAG